MPIVSTGQLTLTDLNDTKQLILYLNANQRTQIFDPNAGTYTPNFPTANLVITPELFIAGGTGVNLLPSANVVSVTWYEGTQTTTPIAEVVGTDYTVATGSPTTVAKPLIVKTNFTAKNSQIYTCVIVYTDSDTGFDVTLKANLDVVKITNGVKGDNGVNAITAVVSNESHAIPTDSAGNSPIYTGSGTEIYLYEGATALTYDGVGTANGTWKATAVGVGITAGAVADSGTFATVAISSAITADTAIITYTITGKQLDGTAINITKKQTVSKAKNGVSGTSPTLYRLIPSTNAIQQNIANVYNPTTMTVTGKSQTGTGVYGDYAGRFIIAESTDGTTFVDKYTSVANEISKVHTPSVTNVKSIRVRFYLAGGVVTMLDEQIIPVVKDGATGAGGADALYLNLWTPSGDTTSNGTGSLTIQADLYKGGSTVTPTAFKWYIQDPSATAVSGGDADGGAGWRLLNVTYNAGTTGYATAVLTVPATAIVGVEGFRCIVTYATLKYNNVIVLKDVTDPIQVNVLGASIFKNGEGSVILTAQLLQNGAELATAGYTFAWAVYNANGTLNKTLVGATDTITVNAVDINGIGNVVVDVSK